MRKARVALFSWGFAGLAALFGSGCATDEAPPPRPVHGSIGEETFGVICDRVGAQALSEDLTGDSYRGVCHRDAAGHYADAVDESRLPKAATDDPKVAEAHAHALARIGALVKHRADLVASLDAMFPGDVMLDVRASALGCAPEGKRALSQELALVLGRMTDAYDDGTIPQVTRALGRFADALAASPDSQAAVARIAARQGYRPESVALGLARPLLAYPHLRDLANATLRILSPDADPYATPAHAPSPGSAYTKLAALSEVTSLEMQTSTASKALLPATRSIDANTGLTLLSRPRTKLEVLSEIASKEDPAFGGGVARYLVKRDSRGIALPAVGTNGEIIAPFVDANSDGLADIDALGQLQLTSGAAAPSPFLAPQRRDDPTPRDSDGRAQDPAGARLLHQYIDLNHAYAASLLNDVSAFVDGEGKNETLMDAMAGAYVLFGPRDGGPLSSRQYGTTVLPYDAFHADASPLVDLAYAAGQTMADPNVDAALASSAWLVQNDETDLAHAVNAALAVKATADAHPEAKIPANSTLWDEIIDVLVKIAAVKSDDGSPVLLEQMLAALADPDAKDLGKILAAYTANRDDVDYNRADINGPPMNVSSGVLNGTLGAAVDRKQPDVLSNRSILQRFLQLVHDTNGVEVCNREGAQIKARMDSPLGGKLDISIPNDLLVRAFWGNRDGFGECEVFHMSNMATFYLDSIVGNAQYVLRDKQLRDGILNINLTATTVHILEQSCDLTGYQPPGTTDAASRTGFWTEPSSGLLMARPQWLNRNLFFPNGVNGDKPARAKAFSDALNPDHAGTAACPTRDVKDPLPKSDPNYTPGGVIHLPDCGDGDWLDQRDSKTIFALETNGFYEAIAPLVRPFSSSGHSALLVELLDVLHKHWADSRVSASDCKMNGYGAQCSKDGAMTYEPILADAFAGDLLPALQSMVRVLSDANGPQFYLPCANKKSTGECVGAKVNGTRALAYALRSAVDPDAAAARGLLDRHGNRAALRNDGKANSQVTPIYLMTSALASMDAAFDAYAQKNPGDAQRSAQWKRARSKIVDRFLGTSTNGGTWSFDDKALPKITPALLNILRQELRAECPEWPNTACAWAATAISDAMARSLGGPLFARGVDLLDAVRQDDAARLEMERLIAYLLDSKSGSDALQSMLVSSTDSAQILQDEENLVPLLHAMAGAMTASKDDPTQKGLLEANVAFLTRLTARGHDANGADDCSREVDPNQVLTHMLEKAVTPIALDARTLTPIEVVLETIADVNRAAPEISGDLSPADYGSVASNVADFLQNKENGLEQFYAIVRNATVR